MVKASVCSLCDVCSDCEWLKDNLGSKGSTGHHVSSTCLLFTHLTRSIQNLSFPTILNISTALSCASCFEPAHTCSTFSFREQQDLTAPLTWSRQEQDK